MSGIVGRNAVVTGAGTGIGRAIALRLSAEGARVVLLGRRVELLEEVAGEAKGETLVLGGEWAVCWGQLLEPDGAPCLERNASTLPVTAMWSEAPAKSPFGGKGVATYTLDIELPPGTGPLALRVGSPLTAYRLWINGVPQGGIGKVGRTPETTDTGPRNRVFQLPE